MTDIFKQNAANKTPDIICFSHLRWDFVYQRPQHLLSRFAKTNRVFFIEEPIFYEGAAKLDLSKREDYLFVVVPHIPHGESGHSLINIQRDLLNKFLIEHEIENFAA
ncbi:MAG: hypothetical protein ACR2HG_01750 [Pyrinomonadaceae bacterium]